MELSLETCHVVTPELGLCSGAVEFSEVVVRHDQAGRSDKLISFTDENSKLLNGHMEIVTNVQQQQL